MPAAMHSPGIWRVGGVGGSGLRQCTQLGDVSWDAGKMPCAELPRWSNNCQLNVCVCVCVLRMKKG